jgi:hypothetical protein
MVSYKVYIMRLLLLPLVMLFTPVVLSGDYVSKVEPIDYKCVPDKEVGMNWDADGDDHQLNTFKSNDHDIFFLTHSSNAPAEAVTFIPRIVDLSWNDSVVYEQNSYTFRKADQDPKRHETYYNSFSCRYFDGELNGRLRRSISCGDFALGAFEFNLITKRFSYSYIGTWHNQSEDSKYEGNSSVLSYGTCRKYFR